jgi:hypothetical protein
MNILKNSFINFTKKCFSSASVLSKMRLKMKQNGTESYLIFNTDAHKVIT